MTTSTPTAAQPEPAPAIDAAKKQRVIATLLRWRNEASEARAANDGLTESLYGRWLFGAARILEELGLHNLTEIAKRASHNGSEQP